MKRWLSRRSDRFTNAFAIAAAFSTYFCMYAFRKPFAAATYEGAGVTLLGVEVEQKTLFVVSQVLGYALSKFVGIRVCSQAGRAARFPVLVGLIVAAEAALIGFGATPASARWAKAAAIFANGLPLGMVWGLVVLYLEGRRASELLLTGLSCSFIVASGVVKDIGRALLAGADLPLPFLASWGVGLPNPLPPVAEYWMPAVTGSLFLPALLLAAWLLEQLPEPSQQDKAERVERVPMGRAERGDFLRRYAVAIGAAVGAYVALTGFRDFRDTYAVELFSELGYDYASHKTVVSQAELLVAFFVMGLLSQLYRVRDNRAGLVVTYGMMLGGLLLTGASTVLLDAGRIDGFWWMTLIGLGAYLAYVPFNSMLFDRVIATTGFAGTAVFGIYLADAAGYAGTVLLLLGKDAVLSGSSDLDFLRALSYLLALGGSVALIVSCAAFLKAPAKLSAPAEHDPTAAQVAAAEA